VACGPQRDCASRRFLGVEDNHEFMARERMQDVVSVAGEVAASILANWPDHDAFALERC
jgi:hypothetical protein